MSPHWQTWCSFCALIAGTFVSEDLTTITAGLLVRDGRIGWVFGIAGCFLGIYLGDLGLWLVGRLVGRGLLGWRWLSSAGLKLRLEAARASFDRRGWLAICAARFLPGTRLPLYLAAGMLGGGFGSFALWSGLAALLWTPLLFGTVALAGPAVVAPLRTALGSGGAVVVAAILLFAVWRSAPRLCRRSLWRRWLASARASLIWPMLVARVSRLWRWEFWPSWLFYLPVLPWIGLLAMRYRSLTCWTAANPGIPHGGVVGESKAAILARLPVEWTVPTLLVPPGTAGQRAAQVEAAMAERGWSFPLILKPDASQRGAGLKLARDAGDVAAYFAENPAAVVVQTYHPGPHEAGIFYYRLPGRRAGRILSITDKRFPEVAGDGRATLEELIWRHPRLRMQAATFLRRHEGDRLRVPAAGETVRLAVAGNHCQGTMFLDGAALITPELERTVDAIARAFPGFSIGRFDVRYRDPAAFVAGRDLAIVELNGVMSESTNIYDPSRSLLSAYRTLYRQWAMLFQIGNAHRRRGIQTTGAWKLLADIRAYYRERKVNLLAD